MEQMTNQQPTEQPMLQEHQPAQAPQKPAPKEDNAVYVGKKPLIGYALAVVTCFSKGSKEVVIKARGQLISRAVDVEEIVKHKFIPELKIKDIRISTEDLQSKDGHPSKVSAIEIVVTKG